MCIFISIQIPRTNIHGYVPAVFIILKMSSQGVSLWHRRLRIPCCHCSGSGSNCGAGLIPGPETSVCHGHGQKTSWPKSKENFTNQLTPNQINVHAVMSIHSTLASVYTKDWQISPVKRRVVNILGFWGHVVFVTAIQLCHCSLKAAKTIH